MFRNLKDKFFIYSILFSFKNYYGLIIVIIVYYENLIHLRVIMYETKRIT